MKKKKRLTRRQRKQGELNGPQAAHQHLHCIACGRHLDPSEFTSGQASYLRCDHGSRFTSCKACVPAAINLIQEHDRTGQAVQAARAWH
jgi:hypothetical protein